MGARGGEQYKIGFHEIDFTLCVCLLIYELSFSFHGLRSCVDSLDELESSCTVPKKHTHNSVTLNIARKGKLTLRIAIVSLGWKKNKNENTRKWRAELNDRHQCLRRRLFEKLSIDFLRGLLLSNADNKSVSTAMTIIFLDLHFFFFHFVFCVFVTWQHYVAVAWLWCRSMRPKAIDIDAIGGAIHLCLRIATFCWHPSYCCSHFLCCSFSFSYALTTFFLESVGLLVCFFFFSNIVSFFLLLFLWLALDSHY